MCLMLQNLAARIERAASDEAADELIAAEIQRLVGLVLDGGTAREKRELLALVKMLTGENP